MSTIVTRAGKGSELTHTELDANFTNLNTTKLETPNAVVPTFTEASTPVQFNGTQPNAGGYNAYKSINTGTTRGGQGYRSNPSAGGSNKVDTHTLFFDLDDDYGLRPGGSYQGDRNFYLQANHTQDTLSIYMDGFSTNTIESFDGANGSYGRTPIELHGSTTTLKAGGTSVLSATSSLMTAGAPLDMDGENIVMGGATLDLEGGSITSTGGSIAFTDDMSLTISSAGNNVLVVNNTSATADGVKIDVGNDSSTQHTSGDIISARRGTGSAFVEAFKVQTISSGAKSEVVMEQLGALTNQTVTTGALTEQGNIEILLNGATRYIKYYS